MKTMLLLTSLLCLVAMPAAADLYISEVYYDHTGGDDGYEWVEIVNTGTITFDLTGYILAWGGTDYSYGTLVLDGQVAACGMYVVGGPNSEAANGNPWFHQVANFTPDIQNSGSTGDGIALFAPGADVLVDTPIDAVVYGSNNNNGLIDETGIAAAADTGDVAAGGSIMRTSLSGNWDMQAIPNANDESFTYYCGIIISNDQSTWGSVKAMYR
jgi:hypothetical protein